ncbi:uncharacterized protein YcbK (DUF882 family) [Vogesella indigofera]|uniref:Uncharacterized protein YcbK (DUF882 family) n=1 Tax=Vogesella indigofera TaxID=45465 RepID=A0A495BLU9_VOGIN|nr:M15 family metallopeptidase [Vogesella indigofera]RKQ61920.1 uncharacterized protein YcbK (DUF882 family) [Vogesella indigofera]
MLLICTIIWIGFRFFYTKTHINKALTIKTKNGKTEHPLQTGWQTGLHYVTNEARLQPTKKLIETIKKHFVIAFLPVFSISLAASSVALSLLFSNLHKTEEFIPNEYKHSSRIKLTLQEEQLAPPPPLPPEAFRDAISEQPRLNRADRSWDKLDAAFVQTVLRLMARLEARGYPMTLLEGYRSPERQDALAGQATLVTKAKGGQSKHQYGLAVDLAPVRNGKVVISERDPWAMQAYQALGEEATAAALTWGGNWSFKDYGHIERSGSLRQLLARKQ